jgi:uncharacterized protein (DUF488 family)
MITKGESSYMLYIVCKKEGHVKPIWQKIWYNSILVDMNYMIATSYFAKTKLIANPISISSKSPFWFTGEHFSLLAPPYSLVIEFKNSQISEEQYVQLYLEKVLNPLDPTDIYSQIIATCGKNATLMCYEKPGQFCHRRIVASWIELSMGIYVPELIF